MILSEFTEQHEEIAFTATDLDDLLVAKIVTLDKVLTQCLCERIKARRK
jgi:hypothetical protein